ncbi:MAG TPA: LCP family protein [Nocardioides sp.]|nr:LCP family protein [Nocardioides sp.]
MPDVKVPMGRHHRHAVLKVILVSQLCIALLTAAGVVFAYERLNGNIANGEPITHEVEKPDHEGDREPLNILVMGSDSREGAANDLESAGATDERSDTTILIHVSADRKDAYGVSLPRDAIIDRPDCRVKGETVPGEQAALFNTAFSVGGAQCTIQTVEKLTGIYIDHFVTVDFNGFKDMVDAVGGVQVCIPQDVDDDEHDIHFDAGNQELTGQDALNYVRERYILSVTGDIGRMKRQQAFIASMVNKVMSADTLSRPDKVYSFLDAATDSIAVDENLDSLGALFDLVTQFEHTGLARIKFVTVPFAEYEPDPNRLVWAPEADDLWERIRADQRLGEDFNDDSLSADDPVGTTGGSGGDGADDEERRAAGLCA